ncbi:MAG: SCO family protein [Phycisphaeraceae bacterium]|nr:SCO family protein [Phycisphaeraceae bacterium]
MKRQISLGVAAVLMLAVSLGSAWMFTARRGAVEPRAELIPAGQSGEVSYLISSESSAGSESAADDAVVLPNFRLTNQHDQPFGLADLRGEVWVGDFIFTRCRSICPIMTARMAQLQKDVADRPGRERVRFVSISVDPEHDTPDVLSAYADKFGADQSRWTFLTGTRQQIWDLCENGFQLGVGVNRDDPDMPIYHSGKFVLVDAAGRVLGYYESSDEQEMTTLTRKLAAMVR